MKILIEMDAADSILAIENGTFVALLRSLTGNDREASTPAMSKNKKSDKATKADQNKPAVEEAAPEKVEEEQKGAAPEKVEEMQEPEYTAEEVTYTLVQVRFQALVVMYTQRPA